MNLARIIAETPGLIRSSLPLAGDAVAQPISAIVHARSGIPYLARADFENAAREAFYPGERPCVNGTKCHGLKTDERYPIGRGYVARELLLGEEMEVWRRMVKDGRLREARALPNRRCLFCQMRDTRKVVAAYLGLRVDPLAVDENGVARRWLQPFRVHIAPGEFSPESCLPAADKRGPHVLLFPFPNLLPQKMRNVREGKIMRTLFDGYPVPAVEGDEQTVNFRQAPASAAGEPFSELSLPPASSSKRGKARRASRRAKKRKKRSGSSSGMTKTRGK